MTAGRLKVAHIVTRLELGGAQQNTLHTVRHLDRSRFDPLLICGRGALLDAEAIGLGCPVHFVPSLVRAVRPHRDLAALWRLTRLLRRERPDIVHTHSSKAGILGRLAARLAGVPVVVHTFHGFGFNREQSPWSRALFVASERFCARFATRLVAVSEANRREALALGVGRPEQYVLIRSGVKLSDFRRLERTRTAPERLALGPEDRLIVTVGPFKPQKNLVDFLRAAATVRAAFPAARFLIVGDGELRPRLEAEAARLGLTDALLLPGWRRDMPALLARADAFVLTSLWEGLPRSLVEAMSAALPCVANAVDGVTDVLKDGETGFLTAPHRPAETADRLLRILRDPALGRRLGEAARRSLGEDFDIDGMVRRQEALYAALAGQTPGPPV
jgi:glycosyltransferase involved in cell wall biosynthesis